MRAHQLGLLRCWGAMGADRMEEGVDVSEACIGSIFECVAGDERAEEA